MNPNVINAALNAGVQIVEQVAPKLKEQFSNALDNLWKWLGGKFGDINWEQKLDSLFEKISGPQIPENVKITPIKKEYVNKAELVEIAKQNIVPNSNEVLAMLNDKAENSYYIYLAYSKDKEMLDQEKNNFVIIKADGLAKDVQSLFNGHELLILK